MGFRCIALIAVVAILCAADKHHHEWQNGKALDVEHNPYFAGIPASTSVQRQDATVGPGGTTEANGKASTASIAVYNTYQKYAIESDGYVYLVEERIHFRWSKSARITMNGTVKFAVEKEKLYLQDDRGKVHETWILKTVEKT
jgi:hypothetical protein